MGYEILHLNIASKIDEHWKLCQMNDDLGESVTLMTEVSVKNELIFTENVVLVGEMEI